MSWDGGRWTIILVRKAIFRVICRKFWRFLKLLLNPTAIYSFQDILNSFQTVTQLSDQNRILQRSTIKIHIPRHPPFYGSDLKVNPISSSDWWHFMTRDRRIKLGSLRSAFYGALTTGPGTADSPLSGSAGGECARSLPLAGSLTWRSCRWAGRPAQHGLCVLDDFRCGMSADSPSAVHPTAT
jgi:hypothetical protein